MTGVVVKEKSQPCQCAWAPGGQWRTAKAGKPTSTSDSKWDRISLVSLAFSIKEGCSRGRGRGEGALPCFPALSKSSLRSWSSKELAHLECLWSLWPSDPRNRRENKQISLPTEGKKTYKTTDSISCAETTQKWNCLKPKKNKGWIGALILWELAIVCRFRECKQKKETYMYCMVSPSFANIRQL